MKQFIRVLVVIVSVLVLFSHCSLAQTSFAEKIIVGDELLTGWSASWCAPPLPTADGGYILGGGSSHPTVDNFYIGHFIKLNSTGHVLWSKFFGDQPGSMKLFQGYPIQSVAIAADGGYAGVGIAITVDSTGHAAGYIAVTKVRTDGTLTWSRSYEAFGDNNRLGEIIGTTDGGF